MTSPYQVAAFHVWVLILLTFNLSTTAVITGKECKDVTFCIEGQRCDGDRCVPCEYGTYQARHETHQETSCKEWTNKPSGRHWEIKTPGSATRDQVWGCIEGYKEYEIGVQDWKCLKIITTTAPVVVKTTLPQTTITSAPEKVQNSDGLSTVEIIVIGCVIFIALVVVAVVAFIFYRRKRKTDLDTSANNGVAPNGNVPSERLSPASLAPLAEAESYPLLTSGDAQLEKTFEEFAAWLVSQELPDVMYQLLLRLPNRQPDSFRPLVVLGYEQQQGFPERAYIQTLIRWRGANPYVDVQNITETLIELGHTETTEMPRYMEYISRLRDTTDCVEANGMPTNSEENSSSQEAAV